MAWMKRILLRYDSLQRMTNKLFIFNDKSMNSETSAIYLPFTLLYNLKFYRKSKTKIS